ncbi:MAG: hypothetical protein WBE65_14225 [Steroidobacteraceae bacterium]
MVRKRVILVLTAVFDVDGCRGLAGFDENRSVFSFFHLTVHA